MGKAKRSHAAQLEESGRLRVLRFSSLAARERFALRHQLGGGLVVRAATSRLLKSEILHTNQYDFYAKREIAVSKIVNFLRIGCCTIEKSLPEHDPTRGLYANRVVVVVINYNSSERYSVRL